MIKGILGVFVAAIIFSAAIFLILNFIGVIAIIVGIFAVGFIIAAILIFILIFAFGFILFFAAIYYILEKKPTVTPGEYTMDMQKGKNEE